MRLKRYSRFKRLIAKTTTYQVSGVLIMGLIVGLLTGQVGTALVGMAWYFPIKAVFFFIHEYFWSLTNWGKTQGTQGTHYEHEDSDIL